MYNSDDVYDLDDLYGQNMIEYCKNHISDTGNNNERKNEIVFVRAVSSHTSNIFKSLHDCYKKELLCDIVVSVGDKIFKTHRFALAMLSVYLRDLLQKTDDNKDGITLQEDSVKSESFEYILEFAYTGKVDFSNSNVETLQNLLIACSYLGVTVLKDFCEEYLSTLVTLENVLGLFMFSHINKMSFLFEVTKHFFTREFIILSETNEYFNLPVEFLQTFIRIKHLAISKRECLIPPTHKEREKFILAGVLRYINENILSESVPSKELAKLLECVKLLEFDVKYLENEISNFPHLNHDIQEVLDLAKSYNSAIL